MIPLGLLLLAALFAFPASKELRRRTVLISLAVFMAGTAPFIGLLSKRAGRLTIGDAGRLNYM
jgi:hypothetical protein